MQTTIKTIKLYSGLGIMSLFVRIRLWDAPYQIVNKLVSHDATIIDLGCGEGIFSNYLALASEKRKVVGVELNNRRIKYSYRGVPNTEFINADINKINIPKLDTIIFMHVLHHLDSLEEQEKLLRACWSKLPMGGKLINIEIEPEFSLKYFITYLTDHFLVPWIFERKLYSKIYFRKSKEWVKLLSGIGFRVKTHNPGKHMPFSHIILECTKV